jgi:hypothetical protein
MLRRDEPFRVFAGGDLDGRVKTLIDGLRKPQQKSECAGMEPSGDEMPFFCLLQDDDLIYDFRIEGDRLLTPPERDEPERDVVVLIEVKVTTLTGFEVGVPSKRF